MSEFIITASTLIHNISHILTGTYKSCDEDYVQLKSEIFDLSIPTIENDRKNTHGDMLHIGGDMKKAAKEYGQKREKV